MAKLNAILSFDLDTYAGVSNETLVVDAKTREIYIPDPSNVFGVQYDKDSKYVKFKVMNVVSEVFKMEDAVIRINYRDSKGIIGSSLAVDKVTYYDTCEFSWVVPNNALKNKGDLYFVVSAVIVDDEGIIQKRWATTLSRVVTPESIYIKAASLDQNERDEIAMLLLLVSEKCNQAVEDIREARDTGITTITNVKDSGIEELNDLISKYGIRFEDLNVLKSRIDQLFDSGNLPNANTEITDIRIGYDGTRYSTAGNAVRIQISNIMGMILDNQFYTPLLIDRDSELIDEENNILQADWQYKVDGNQSLNRDSCDVEVSGNVTYEFEGLINQAKNELNQIKTDTSTLKDEANTSAVNAKTSEDKAKEYADNLQASTDDISKLKEDLGNQKKAINELNDKKITKFYASNQGETHITDSDKGLIQDMMIYGQSKQDGEPSLSNPVEIKNVVNPTIKVIGKNLWKIHEHGYINNTNGDIADSHIELYGVTDFIKMKKNIVVQSKSFDKTSNYAFAFRLGFYDSEKKWIQNTIIQTLSNPNVVDISSFHVSKAEYIRVSAPNTIFDDLQIEYGTQASEYEPYKEQSIALPITLNAIPVSSGGNVTINGQQYIADYVDVERGKLVRKVDSSKLDNTQSIIDKTEWLLSEQQETDLTTEQKQALKELATYYPVTNISVNSEQLEGYTVFNYPISLANGWNYVKKQLNDNRDYIYDMDLQSAEAYVNSEYAVTLTELEV